MVTRLTKLGISLCLHVLHTGCALLCAPGGQTRPTTCVILTYHALRPEQRAGFGRQMDLLKKTCTPISLDRIHCLESNRRYAAVTFDDGFQSVIANALPELIARRIPVTLFTPTGYLGRRPGWIENPAHPNFNETILDREQLAHLPSSLVTIGSHSVTHADLSQMGSQALLAELQESRNMLTNITGTKIDLLSFPYGAWNDDTLRMAGQAGYRKTFMNIPGPFAESSFLTGRITASTEDWLLEFYLKLVGAYQWLPVGITAKLSLKNLFKSTRPGRQQGTYPNEED